MSEAILSAGAVLWRRGRRPGTEVLLVHRPKYDDWSLPKGKREPGEHVLLTAVREVLEETSVRPVLGPRLPTTEYLARGRPKQVDYWSAARARCRGRAQPRDRRGVPGCRCRRRRTGSATPTTPT